MGWVSDNTHKDGVAKKGMRIRMVNMEDEMPVDEGLEGTINNIDSLGTIHVNWDDGRLLGVIPGMDKYELLPPSEEQIDMDSFTELFGESSDSKPVLRGSQSSQAGKNFTKNFKSAISKTRPKVKMKVESEEINGGKAEGLTIQDIAKKHKVPIGDIKKEIKLGAKVEMEHTNSKAKAKEIAMDHVTEFHDYYSNKKHGAIASEKGLEKDLKETSTKGGTSIKDEVQRILSTIKTAQYQHKDTVETMINNFYKKHKGKVSDADKLTKIYTNLLDKLESKFNVDETSTGGGVSTGVFIGPLGGKGETVIKKPFAKQIGKEITGKKSISNPTGKIYTVNKKTESKIYKKKDIINELSSTSATKLRNIEGSFDGDAWVGDEKGWERKDELAWEGGEISDILAKMDINWTDSDLSLTDKQTDKINEGWLIKSKEDKLVLSILKRVKQHLPDDLGIGSTRYTSAPTEGEDIRFSLPGIKQDAKIRVTHGRNTYGDTYAYIQVNNVKLKSSKWAIGKLYDYLYDILEEKHDKESLNQIQSDLTDPNFAQDVFDILGDEEINETKKKKTKEEDIEEATTHASVWGANGPPVVPIFGAKGKDHVPSRKPIFKGGKIVQKINNSGVLTEQIEVEDSPIPGVTSAQFRDELMGVWGLQNVEFIKKGTYSTDSKEEYILNNEGFINTPNGDRPKIATLNGKTIMTWKMPKYDLFQEVNKVKWVKGGKYVKIKDKCAKYNNQPWCSQGAIDSPLEFSDTVFESIGEISKVTGLSEEKILDRIKAKLKGVTPEQMEYNKEHGLPIWWKGSKEGFYEKIEPRKNYTGSN